MGTLGVATLTTQVDLSGLQRGLSKGEQQTQGLTKRIGLAATAAFAAAAAAVAAFVADSLEEFQTLESGMAEVFSIMPGVTEQVMGQMTDDVLAFSSEVGRTSEETVPALYQALSSGVPASNVFDFMKIASDAALGGVTDLETAVNGITSAINAYGAEALSAQEASDLMFTATVGGKTTFEELSQSLYNVIPTAAGLGVEFGNITAALAAVTAQGTPTSVATTQLRQLLIELSQAGGDAAMAFERMAGESFVDFIAGGGNLQEALQLMEQAAADSGVRLTDMFGSVEAGAIALSLTGAGAKKFSDELAAATDSAGATSDAAAVMADTMQHTEDIVAAQTSELKILIAEGLVPTKRAWLELKKEFLESAIEFTRHNNEINAGQSDRDQLVDQLKQIAGETDGLISVNGGAADSWDAINLALIELSKTYPSQSGSLEELETNMEAVEAMTQLLTDGFEGNGRELAAAAIGAVQAAEAQAELAAETERAAAVTEYMTSARRFDTEGLEQNIIALAEQAAVAAEAVRINEDLAEKAAQLAAQEAAADPAIRAANLAMQEQAEAAAADAAALAATSAAMGDYFVAATQATDAVGFFSTTTTDAGAVLVDTEVSQASLNQAMYDAAVAAGASATELAVLGVATGVLSEEQAEAALKTAILQAGVAELAAAYVAGDLSVSGLRTQMNNLVADVNNMDIEIGASTGEVDIYAGSIGEAGTAALTAAEHIGGLRTAAEDAAGNYAIHFDITQTGAIPNPNGGYAGSGGAGNVAPDDGYALGGYTGRGPASEIAGFVHRNEFVFPPDAVDDLGLPFLGSLVQGKMRPRDSFDYGAVEPIVRPQPQNAAANGARGTTLHFDLRGAVISSQAEMEKWVDAALLKQGTRADTYIRTR